MAGLFVGRASEPVRGLNRASHAIDPPPVGASLLAMLFRFSCTRQIKHREQARSYTKAVQ
jgi:hypothetical protein